MVTTSYITQIKENWNEVWKKKNFQLQFFFTLAMIIGVASFFPHYFDYLEARQGRVLSDIVVDNIPAKDVSWMVFFFLYTGVIICLACNFIHPKNLVIAFQTYAFVTITRVVSLYFVHLNPPLGYIELKEPVLSLLFTTNGKICSHDLFFSGHVSSILSIYYSVSQKKFKAILLFFSIMIGVLVLIQHVHYTIDVLAAVPFTWLCYKASKKLVAGKNL